MCWLFREWANHEKLVQECVASIPLMIMMMMMIDVREFVLHLFLVSFWIVWQALDYFWIVHCEWCLPQPLC